MFHNTARNKFNVVLFALVSLVYLSCTSSAREWSTSIPFPSVPRSQCFWWSLTRPFGTRKRCDKRLKQIYGEMSTYWMVGAEWEPLIHVSIWQVTNKTYHHYIWSKHWCPIFRKMCGNTFLLCILTSLALPQLAYTHTHIHLSALRVSSFSAESFQTGSCPNQSL